MRAAGRRVRFVSAENTILSRMGPTSADTKPLALFVSLADHDFTKKVRDTLAEWCMIEDIPSLTDFVEETAASFVVAAFSSPREISPLIGSLRRVVPGVPYFIVYPDDSPIDLEPELSRISRELIEMRMSFKTIPYAALSSLLDRYVLGAASTLTVEVGDSHSLGDHVAVAVSSDRPPLSPDLQITFDEGLSTEQIKSTLTALAKYYRACGGVGLSVEFENQEAVPEEVHA